MLKLYLIRIPQKIADEKSPQNSLYHAMQFKLENRAKFLSDCKIFKFLQKDFSIKFIK